MAKPIFWISLAYIFYTYAGYPLFLWLARLVFHRPVQKAYWEPDVTVLIAVYNESAHIERKLSNCLELDYPRDRLQIVVSLDAPEDGTDAIVKTFAADGIQIVPSTEHRGKATALNRAAARARGDILVFTDSRQRLEPNVIRELVANFKDPDVGAVTGELVLLGGEENESSKGVGVYWKYEKWIRKMESDLHSTVVATGAIYAIRRELFKKIPEGTILDDMMVPLRAVLAGKRIVFDPKARAYDRLADWTVEYGRRVRTLTGNYQLLTLMPELLIPWRNSIVFQFVSHKIARLFVPYFLSALLLSNAFLLHGLYAVFFLAQAIWYLLALAGILWTGNSRVNVDSRLSPIEGGHEG